MENKSFEIQEDVQVNDVKKRRRQAFVDQKICVGCGCCVKVCPLGAIQVVKGMMAQVDLGKCVGCGRCAKECPASIIEIQEVQA